MPCGAREAVRPEGNRRVNGGPQAPRGRCRAVQRHAAKPVPGYPGFRAWRKYIGVKMPSRPASIIPSAQRFSILDTWTVPCGTMCSVSSTRSVLWVTQRPTLEPRKAARDRPDPTSG